MAVRWEGGVWLMSTFFRFLWACSPQTGYIHPDEFFQATEITAGDIFGFKHLRTWEFNETFPVRTVAFQYILSGLPFYLLNMGFDSSLITTTKLIVASRFSMTCASLIIDLSVYIICRRLHFDPAIWLCVLGTSFVTLVFHTRSFSNSVESILFSLLLMLVVSAILNNNQLRTSLDLLQYSFIGIVVTAGIWNRPTFVTFSFVPLVSWLFDICVQQWKAQGKLRVIILQVVKRVYFMATGTVVTAVVLIMVDSNYFGYLRRRELVLTPLNFFRYNLDSNSLKEHGLHPRFTHLVVNIPLLFGPMAFALFSSITCALLKVDLLKNIRISLAGGVKPQKQKSKLDKDKWKSSSIKGMFLCSSLVPVALLSIIPHQEPRFLIPVLVPLVILYSKQLVGSSATPLMSLLWFSWNILGCLFFGALHQGGVCSCLGYLQEYLSTRRTETMDVTYHLTFYHTYMPPVHLLSWPDNSSQSLFVHDLQGTSSGVLKKHLNIICSNHKVLENKENKIEAFVICPSTVKFEHPGFILKKQFFPHISMEDLPDVNVLFHSSENGFSDCSSSSSGHKYIVSNTIKMHCLKGIQPMHLEHISSRIYSELSLNVYQFIRNSTSVD